jgi:hypothetical protein
MQGPPPVPPKTSYTLVKKKRRGTKLQLSPMKASLGNVSGRVLEDSVSCNKKGVYFKTDPHNSNTAVFEEKN